MPLIVIGRLDSKPGVHWKKITSQTDNYLVSLYSKTYLFEDKLTKY